MDKNTPSVLGEIGICKDYDECIIINAYTQYYLGKDKYGKDSNNNRYKAIRECLNKVNKQFPNKHIGVPLIGCGLAGLKWSKVKKIVREELKDMKISIIHYDGN